MTTSGAYSTRHSKPNSLSQTNGSMFRRGSASSRALQKELGLGFQLNVPMRVYHRSGMPHGECADNLSDHTPAMSAATSCQLWGCRPQQSYGEVPLCLSHPQRGKWADGGRCNRLMSDANFHLLDHAGIALRVQDDLTANASRRSSTTSCASVYQVLQILVTSDIYGGGTPEYFRICFMSCPLFLLCSLLWPASFAHPGTVSWPEVVQRGTATPSGNWGFFSFRRSTCCDDVTRS